MKSDLYQKGMQVRRAVMGDEYVDASLADVDDFNGPMQDMVTETAWGGVWSREGLERKTRSMLNLAMLTALNRPHELRGHVRGALRNGVTADEIREILMQAAIYCGMPAGLDAFRVARAVIKEMQEQQAAA
jgi:4-carboxymuconolactone decarboxylase